MARQGEKAPVPPPASSFPYLRVHKMPLVVIEASTAEVAVAQGLLQEMPPVHLVPGVFDLGPGRNTGRVSNGPRAHAGWLPPSHCRPAGRKLSLDEQQESQPAPAPQLCAHPKAPSLPPTAHNSKGLGKNASQQEMPQSHHSSMSHIGWATSRSASGRLRTPNQTTKGRRQENASLPLLLLGPLCCYGG